MTKKQLTSIRELKRKMAMDSAKHTREYKKSEFEKAMAKDKVETHGDIYGIFCGLSKRAMEVSALCRIETLAVMGYNPKRIIELMEPKKGKAHED